MGFKDCLRKFYPDFVKTYRHHMVNSRYPWELCIKGKRQRKILGNNAYPETEINFNKFINAINDLKSLVIPHDLQITLSFSL